MRIILETAEPYSIQCVKEKRENALNIVVRVVARGKSSDNTRLKIEVGGGRMVGKWETRRREYLSTSFK